MSLKVLHTVHCHENVKRSVWRAFINQPKTRASAKPVPVIRQLAEILDEYRCSMCNPQSGVMFHLGGGHHMDFGKLARQIQPVVESLGIDVYGWHGFRRGIASNLYELSADEKIVQRVLRHAKSHVTKDRYIKALDPAVVAAMKNLEATVDSVITSTPRVHRIEATQTTKSSTIIHYLGLRSVSTSVSPSHFS